LIVEKKLDFVWSYISDYENGRNPYTIRKDSIRNFSYRCTDYIDHTKTDEIAKQASDIRKTGIKEKDSLHLACAISANSDYFISTDDRLLKFKTEKIKLVTPTQFISEMEGNL
jgi:predicted nucleic acid-binding protein